MNGKAGPEGLEWSDYVPSERDGILHRARHGEIGPKEAEEWALKNDQPPFATTPDADRFDAMAEPYWSLAMAAAWNIWRSPHLVRDHWNDYRAECRDWRAQDNILSGGSRKLGWVIDRRKPASLFTTLNEAPLKRLAPSMVVSPTACHRELRLCFLEGKLTSTGIPHGQKARVVIPKHDWIDLDAFAHRDWGPDAIGVNGENHARYDGVRVPRAEVMALWQPLTPSIPLVEPDRKGQVLASAPKPLSEDEASELIRDAAARRRGFVSLADGVAILKARDPSMKRDSARAIVKSIIANEKKGPRGPRRNSAN